jgi:hypothetical protein
MEHVGTADVVVPERLLVVDLKSGKVRNYREQVAAYAFGLMEEHFAMRWTCVLLFCDARQMVVHEFTYEEAQALVEGLLRAVADPAKKRCSVITATGARIRPAAMRGWRL